MLNNQSMQKLSPKQINLLSILIEMNAWEQKNSQSLQTQSGRSLYFQLAQVLLDPSEGGGDLLKQTVGEASERSTRDHLRLFQEAGLLTTKRGAHDARTKQIVPTEKFTEALREHLDHGIRLLEHHYFLVEK